MTINIAKYFLFVVTVSVLTAACARKIVPNAKGEPAGNLSHSGADGFTKSSLSHPQMFGDNKVRATGNEPFWILELRKDSLLFNVLGGDTYLEPLSPPRVDNQDSLIYKIVTTNGTALDILVANKACIDNMSGFQKRFSVSVSVIRPDKTTTYAGCADYLSEYHKVMEVH